MASDTKISGLTAKSPPVDSDSIPIYDSAGDATKRITGTVLKAYLKTYFDTLYGRNVADEALGGSGVNRTLAQTPLDGTLIISDGAAILHKTADFTQSGTAVTFTVAPDNPYASYRY